MTKEEILRTSPAFQIPCPKCGVDVGQPCSVWDGWPCFCSERGMVKKD